MATDYQIISELGSSARSIGLANIHGFGDYRTASFTNPASLSQTDRLSFSLFTTTLMTDLQYLSGSVNVNLAKGKLGLAYYQAGTSDIYSSDVTEDQRFEATGVFGYKNTISKLSYQLQPFKHTSIGTSLAYFTQSSLEVSGKGLNVDLGLIHDFERFSLSLYAQNVLRSASISYADPDAKEELFPLIVSTTAKIPVSGFTLFPQVKMHNDTFLLACGLSYSPSFFSHLELLMGCTQELDALENAHNNASFGLGLQLIGLDLNYSFVKSDYFLTDHSNFFSLSYAF